MRRCIGLDVHREFAEVAIWEDGIVRSAGQVKTTPEELRLFAGSLAPTDEVALEATCNTHAIARLLERHVARVVVSNPAKTRAIAEAKVKTDKVDAQVLAQLLAAGFLPSCWLPDDEPTRCGARSPAGHTSSVNAPGGRMASTPSSTAISCRAVRRPTSSATRAGAGSPSRSCRPTSARPSRRCFDSSISPARSCA